MGMLGWRSGAGEHEGEYSVGGYSRCIEWSSDGDRDSCQLVSRTWFIVDDRRGGGRRDRGFMKATFGHVGVRRPRE